MTSLRNRRLVLHFNVNNTIKMRSSNDTTKDVQCIVAKSAWGIMKSQEGIEEMKWTLAHDQLTFACPEKPSYLEGEEDEKKGEKPEVVSFYDYIC